MDEPEKELWVAVTCIVSMQPSLNIHVHIREQVMMTPGAKVVTGFEVFREVGVKVMYRTLAGHLAKQSQA